MSKRNCADLNKIPKALEKTGFILEHIVSEKFRKAGWWTINGRYYADDVDGRARELDLIAYRAKKEKEIEVVSAVLISCKKDEQMTWAFLTREKPKSDPNFDWDPMHYWTDVEPLQTYLSSEAWKADYLKKFGSKYSKEMAARKDVFSFQQISSASVTAQNDKQIFDSISSLMKALDYEMSAVQSRARKRNRLYLFYLLTVVDASVVDVDYSNDEPVAVEVERITHLARYMVRKHDLSALVHFIRSDKLDDFISNISGVSNIGSKQFSNLAAKSYDAIISNKKIREHFSEKIKMRIIREVNSAFRRNGKSSVKAGDLGLDYDDGKLLIQLDVYEDDEIEILNTDELLNKYSKKLLKELTRYEGAFVFEGYVPF